MDTFFVRRPVFAWVIAAFVMLFGLIALSVLPIEQYPSVAPPSLTLSYGYNGADADTMDKNVTAVIERELNGVANFQYMASTSRANGTAEIVLTFKPGTSLDTARVQVQDRINRASPRLPEDVRRLGIQISDNSAGFLQVVAVTSKSGLTSELELGDFASNKVVNELRRVPGVGNVQLFSSEKAMRIWLDPEKLAGFGLSASEILAAVQEQNSQTAGGALGDQPVAQGADTTAKIVTQNRFTSTDQFRNIIVRANPDGSTIRLRDVGRVEIGADSYSFKSTLNGKSIAAIGIQLATGANALATRDAVVERMKVLQSTFPADVGWSLPYDTTPFIDASIENVVSTLVEAMVLVFLVMFLFLQNWRATVIPTIVVPIALAGGCIGLWAFGFSINVLSLFAMVVAIGILVDDAIVVVENVERIMADEGLSPPQATIKAMGQIRGAIIGITLVLIAVFLPMAFFPGSTGGIYRQFSVTLAVSIFFSALLALTLTPALCATLLKPHGAEHGDVALHRSGWRGWMPRFFAWFNQHFGRATDRYVAGVSSMLSRPKRWLAVTLMVFAVTGALFTQLPGGFLPEEDQGYYLISYDAPAGATTQRTDKSVRIAEAALAKDPAVRDMVSVTGFNFFGQGQSAAISFAVLKPYDQRSPLSLEESMTKLYEAVIRLPDATVFPLNPPAISALGNATGFTMKIEDRGGNDAAGLERATNAILAAAAKNPKLTGMRLEGQPPAPQLFVDIDRVQARALGLSIADVNATLSIAFGSAYANDFSNEGQVQRVYLQSDAEHRMTPDDVLALRVRSSDGQMAPFSAFTRVRWTDGATQVGRYNGYAATTIAGQAAPGVSSGTALAEMEQVARTTLKGNLSFEWTGSAFEEKQAGGQIGVLLGLSSIVVFLLLAALYNSWAIPLSVLLVVPFGILGAVVSTWLRGLSADVYFNIGLITIIGLAAKNAILIVEFAIEEEAAGRSLMEATLEASRQRLRPILMTSLAFILGMVPLLIAMGAGAASRQAVGTGVAGGMLTATLIGIYFTPLFYAAAKTWLTSRRPDCEDDARNETSTEKKESTHA